MVFQLFLFDSGNFISKLCPSGKEAYPCTEFEKINTNHLQMELRSSNSAATLATGLYSVCGLF